MCSGSCVTPETSGPARARERIYLDGFCNEFPADPKAFAEACREHYAELFPQPGTVHAGFNQFAAFDQ
jgi:hypothetical protein